MAAAFALANVVAYLVAIRRWNEDLVANIGRTQRAPASSFRWGFPFNWQGHNFGQREDSLVWILVYPADGLLLNALVVVVCGFLVGFLFRWFKAIRQGVK